jgi:hypothetical protein
MSNYLNAVQPVGICGNLLEFTVNLLPTPTPTDKRPSQLSQGAFKGIRQYEHTRET